MTVPPAVPPADEATARPRLAAPARWTRAFAARAGAAIAAPGRLWFVTPLYLYALTRVLQLLVLRLMIPPEARLTDALLRWDAEWYVRIARSGYPPSLEPAGNLAYAPGGAFAFFPGYPLAIRGTATALGLDLETAALAVAGIAGAVAAVLLYALIRAVTDDRVATVLTVLFLSQPMSVVLGMAYAESLFLALAFGSLLAAFHHRWLLAGALCFLAGLTRGTGVAVAAGLVVAAALAVAKREHGRRRWPAAVAAVVGAAGVPAYVAWVGLRVGDPWAYFTIQREGWGTAFDLGASMPTIVVNGLFHTREWVHTSVAWMLIVVAVVTVMAARSRLWPPLLVYGLTMIALVFLQAGPYWSKVRLLVPAVITLVPAAVALARGRPRAALCGLASSPSSGSGTAPTCSPCGRSPCSRPGRSVRGRGHGRTGRPAPAAPRPARVTARGPP